MRQMPWMKSILSERLRFVQTHVPEGIAHIALGCDLCFRQAMAANVNLAGIGANQTHQDAHDRGSPALLAPTKPMICPTGSSRSSAWSANSA